MNANAIAKGLNAPGVGFAVLGVVGIVGVYVVYHILKDAGKALKDTAGEVISGASEIVGGIATGKNAVTVGTAYEGAGVLGTLGGAVDKVGGGIFSQIGEWSGDKLYEWFGDDYDPNLGNTSTGNPLSPTGPQSSYRQAANNSPVNAQYRATPYVTVSRSNH